MQAVSWSFCGSHASCLLSCFVLRVSCLVIGGAREPSFVTVPLGVQGNRRAQLLTAQGGWVFLWQDILLTFAELELDSRTMFTPGTNVLFIRSPGEATLAQSLDIQVQILVSILRMMTLPVAGSQKSARTCQASYQKGQTTTQYCCPKPSSGKW